MEKEKQYCECGNDEDMGNNEKGYHCFNCGKPNYANWWADEMNKKCLCPIASLVENTNGYICNVCGKKYTVSERYNKSCEEAEIKWKYEWDKIEDDWKKHVGNWDTVGTKSAFNWFKNRLK